MTLCVRRSGTFSRRVNPMCSTKSVLGVLNQSRARSSETGVGASVLRALRIRPAVRGQGAALATGRATSGIHGSPPGGVCTPPSPRFSTDHRYGHAAAFFIRRSHTRMAGVVGATRSKTRGFQITSQARQGYAAINAMEYGSSFSCATGRLSCCSTPRFRGTRSIA